MAFSINQAQAAERAFTNAVPDGNEESGITIPEVESMIPDAIRSLIDEIAKSKQYYRLHDNNISVNVTNGLGILPEDVLAESVKESYGGKVIFNRSDVSFPQPRGTLKWMPDLSKLARPRPGGDKICYYTVYGTADAGELYVYSGYGVPCSGTATVTAARYYTFATMPAQLEDEFVYWLTDIVRKRLEPRRELDRGAIPTQGVDTANDFFEAP